ncbi:hypothetical protein OZ410_02775 [Robiginitalea sp. M366]|uniref:hypothetical protein n=1 Tax=Robiginitalea aestuariiviva TaxID=3036903 RepID=UPI00240D81FC|nr:hypothetical protein [Robiginitalea aestuariiviva]MDG1571223.1 hypothetical protein [Robiginitalea aestuariiviva]
MGKKKKTSKKAEKAEKLRQKRLVTLAVAACPPEGCKSKCCKKYKKCESKRCKKCPCFDLLQSLQPAGGFSQVA